MTELMRLRDLRVDFARGRDLPQPVLRGVDLSIDVGEAVALVGPSGCGKTMTALAMCGLLPPDSLRGEVLWRGQVVGSAGGPRWRDIRGHGVTFMPQDPSAGLNPVLRVGDQIAETVRRHHGLGAGGARRRAVDLLAETRVPEPERCARAWPHELSGGMLQRAVLAAALACDPALLVADEPTTALDPMVQATILRLIDDLRRERGMALLFISHDPDLVRLLTDRAVHLVEGRTAAAPQVVRPVVRERKPAEADGETVVDGQGLVARYDRWSRPAVGGVDVALRAGRIVGLAGGSGSGKTTLARMLAGFLRPESGRVDVGGEDLHSLGGAHFRRARRGVQLLFQSAGASLDPRQTAAGSLVEAGAELSVVGDLLKEVGLSADLGGRLPHQLSGGQAQRVALARCLAVRPRALIADEPTSALDREAAARIHELLAGIATGRGLALLIVSHDLPALLAVCDEIVVMQQGIILERFAPSRPEAPAHPYTRSLLAVAPSRLVGDAALWRGLRGPARKAAKGGGEGCPHATACDIAKDQCHSRLPGLERVAPGWFLRCPEMDLPTQSQFIDT